VEGEVRHVSGRDVRDLFQGAGFVTESLGALIYWRASRRRGAARSVEPPSSAGHPGSSSWR
jgi:hypothetical protein